MDLSALSPEERKRAMRKFWMGILAGLASGFIIMLLLFSVLL